MRRDPTPAPRAAPTGAAATLALSVLALLAAPAAVAQLPDYHPNISSTPVISQVKCVPHNAYPDLDDSLTVDIRRVEYLHAETVGGNEAIHPTGWIARDSIYAPHRVSGTPNNAAGPATPDTNQNSFGDDGWLTILDGGFFKARMDVPILNQPGPDLAVYERNKDTSLPTNITERAEGYCIYGAKEDPSNPGRPSGSHPFFFIGTNLPVTSGEPERTEFDLAAPNGYFANGGPNGFTWILIVEALSTINRPDVAIGIDGDESTPFDGDRVTALAGTNPTLEGFQARDPVRFEDLTVLPAGTVPSDYEYKWQVDGPAGLLTLPPEPGTYPDAHYTFPGLGFFTVTLTVTHLSSGLTGVGMRDVMLLNTPPQCGFVPIQPEGGAGHTEFLDLSYDLDDNQRIALWRWDFGDGTNSTSSHPFHQYAERDSDGDPTNGDTPYLVRLNVTDSHRRFPMSAECVRPVWANPPLNHAPVLQGVADLRLEPGHDVDVQLTATDADIEFAHQHGLPANETQTLTFRPQGGIPASLPPFASLTTDGALHLSPTLEHKGLWAAKVEVFDGAGGHDAATILVHVNVAVQDSDQDATPDAADNCPALYNPSQFDGNGNGVGDACDGTLPPPPPPPVSIPDRDGDGLQDILDNCPATRNPDQDDGDADETGDVCDVAPQDPEIRERILLADVDRDGVLDTEDNCPLDANADQANLDGDLEGDICDGDRDNDGVPERPTGRFEEHLDNCPDLANGFQVDRDGDGDGDECDAFPDGQATPAGNPPPGALRGDGRSWFERNVLDRPAGFTAFAVALAGLAGAVSVGVLRWARPPRP